MSDDTTTVDTTEDTTTTPETTETEVEKQAFLDRLNKESGKRKDAEKRAATIEKELADLKARMEEREHEGLPELERERKRAEALEKRAADAEAKAQETEQKLVLNDRKGLVLAAASKAGFDDPSDATRYPEFVDLDQIEDADAAERAVKRLAKAKPRLLKDEETKLPGRVLDGGRTATKKTEGGIDPSAEAEMLANGLKKFLKDRDAA